MAHIQNQFFCNVIITEARYHYVVERTPLREGSAAWRRAQASNLSIPTEMAQWVNSEMNASNTSNQELESARA